MLQFTDQTGNSFYLSQPPKRIVSLVPSQTELLHHLGLDTEVVGITKFCIHPTAWRRNKQRIGGTKNIHTATIRSLQPDLIIANKEENIREEVLALMSGFPVYVSDVNNLPDALGMIRDIGRITGKEAAALNMAAEISNGFDGLVVRQPVKAAYLIWREPYMTVGGDTFINDMMKRAGLHNVFANRERYPAITLTDLQQSGCSVVLLSSEPYPFKAQHQEELRHALPGVEVILVDGEYFSWYGSRMLHAPAYFRHLQQQLLHVQA